MFSLNGSYSHTCLALRCLRRPLETAGFEVVLLESNLRDRCDEVLQSLYDSHADIYSFSCYIWNIEESLSLAADLSALLPSAKIIFGGPEVWYDSDRFSTYDFIDCIVRGEGEDALTELCLGIERGETLPRVVDAKVPRVMEDEGILYRDGDFHAGGMLYYESSRGCPYSCAYCLSSAQRGAELRAWRMCLRTWRHLRSLARILRSSNLLTALLILT